VFLNDGGKCLSTRSFTKRRRLSKLPQKNGTLDDLIRWDGAFVGSKANKQWVWLAIDAGSRGIAGMFVGDRSQQSAKGLWRSSPAVCRQCAICYTDFWEVYGQVFPSKQDRAVGKETGKTGYIGRFNNTLRQRMGRLVRQTLSFPKKLSNHTGAIWYFVHHYNAPLRSHYDSPLAAGGTWFIFLSS
jgi:insertion element IS1 protein InsB